MKKQENRIASRLKKARESLDFTQEELGNGLGLAWFAIRDIEAGKKILTPDIAKKIEGIYSINFRWLLTGEEEMFIPPRRFLGDGLSDPPEEVSLLLDKACTYIHRDKSLTTAEAAVLIYEAPEEFRASLVLALERELFFLAGRIEKVKMD